MMNFNLPNAILTSRVQQQQQQQQHSHPSSNSQIPASTMSSQPSFPTSDDSTKQSQLGSPGVNPQAHVPHPQNNNNNNNNNNSNSHGVSLPSAQQLLMQQNRNSNVTNHPQINKTMTQMTSTSSQQQTTFHQQQVMTSITKTPSMNILQQMNQFVYQQQPGPISNVQQSHNMQHAMGNSGTQKFQQSHQQQQPQMHMRQNYGASPPHVINTTSAQSQQNMQYSPSKPIHPQMKTTAKLASPGSQLQTLQKSPPQGTLQSVPTVPSLQQQQQQQPLNVAQQVVTQPQINPNPQPSTTTTTSSNVASSQKIAQTIPSPVKNVPVQSSPPSAISNVPVSIPLQSNPQNTSSSVPSSITVTSSLSISSSVPIQTSSSSSSSQVSTELNTSSQDASAVQQPKVVVENKPTAPQPSANTATNNNDAGQKISPSKPIEEKKSIISPPVVKSSTMRLATVTTPPRKKPPPTITKKVTPQSAQKKIASSVPVKSEGFEKPKKSLPENPKPSTSLYATKKSENPKSTVAAESSLGPSNVTPKTKRIRTKVQPYQSPTPEIALVTKLSTQIANGGNGTNKNGDDKLTLFYKNEFLAVRNGEGGFYLCQAMHNVYRSSPKIKIRWLNEREEGKLSATGGRVYSFDFYDLTDLECVLTTVELEKVESKTYELPQEEIARIESILKKAIDVEKGVLPRPSVTENNPDGLDLSIYKDESQLDKLSSSRKRKGKKSDEDDDDDAEDDEPLSKKNKPTETTPGKKSLAPRASTRKPIVDAETESSESDEENLMEIKKKAKIQVVETNKAEKVAPKSSEKKIEAKPVVAARGRKRMAEKIEDALPEKTPKVLQTERVEEKKQVSPQKASPKAAKNVKAAAQFPAVKESVKTNVKEKKQSAKDKPSDSTTVVKKVTLSKVQTSPPAAGKNKVTKTVTSPPNSVKKSQVKEEIASPRGRSTRSKK